MVWRFWRRHDELREEIDTHLRMAERDRVERGEPEPEARARARHDFGNVPLIVDRTEDTWRGVWLARLLQDVRFGVRLLRRNPGFTAVILLCLTLGLGVSTTIFSAVNGLFLRALPYADADRLVVIRSVNTRDPRGSGGVSWADFLSWQAASPAIAEAGVWSPALATFIQPEQDREPLAGAVVSPGVLPLIRIPIAQGRDFLPSEQQFGNHHRVILSDALWRRRFGANPDVVGRTVIVERRPVPPTPHLIVGVLAPTAAFPEQAEFWIPAQLDADEVERHDARYFQGVVARLARGATIEQADAQITSVSDALAERHPASNAGWQARVTSLRGALIGDLRTPVLLFQGAALLVLLIACANVANLLIARGASRSREMALRAAIGAGRARLVRQVITESVVIAAAGGAGGVLVAFAGVRLLPTTFPVEVPAYARFTVDGRALAFALVATLTTGLIFGLVPALRAAGTSLTEVGGMTNQPSASARDRRRLRAVLIAVEIALSTVLVIGAALVLRSNHSILTGLGFEPHGVLYVSIPTPPERYEGAPREAFFETLSEQLRALPGVVSVGRAGVGPPLGSAGGLRRVQVSIVGQPASADPASAIVHEISPDYLSTLGAVITEGRGFFASDRPANEAELLPAIVNEAFVRAYLRGGSAVGRQLGESSRVFTVVGVVRDFRQERPPRPIASAVYVYSPFGDNNTPLVIRTSLADPHALVADIRQAVRRLDPELRVAVSLTLDTILSRALWRERVHALVLSVFAALALTLAMVGVFGVVAYDVAQRMREFGIRIALGATRQRILQTAMAQGVWPTLVGILAGLSAASALTGLLESVLYGIQPTEPGTFIVAAVVMTGLALLACILAARHATRVDCMTVLKAE